MQTREVQLYSFFNLGTRWGGWMCGWLNYTSAALLPGMTMTRYPFFAGWAGPRPDLDGCGKF